jgi:hypothetical protein
MTALRTLLGGIVDYAGLFPPAALDMSTAVRNYAAYRGDPDAWMLGRFVVPVARLGEFAESRATHAADRGVWRLTALFGAEPAADVARVREFNRTNASESVVDSLEGRLSTPEDIERIGGVVGGEFELFAELSDDREPAPLIASLRRVGAHGKIRTGGVTAAAIPPAATIVRFIRACLDAGVSFKATAGLHHPLRAQYRLTYAPDSPTGVMYGYLNVFLATALMAQGLDDADATRVLEERDPDAFTIEDVSIDWRGHSVTRDQIARVRQHVALSFGSCSFREPVDELRTLATA